MGLISAVEWFSRAKFTFILLIVACCWRVAVSQLDAGCTEGETTCRSCQDNEYGVQCQPCDCDPVGSLGSCDLVSGACYCRKGVESRRCNTCDRQGWIGPSRTSNQAACLQCFCSGYSNICTSAKDWYKASVSDYFSTGDGIEDWRDAKGGNVTYEEEGFLRVMGGAGGVKLLFPAQYLGDKRTLFGQQLFLTLRQSSLQHNVTMVTVRIGTTVSSPYDDGLQLEMSPVAIDNNWQTIQVTTQLMMRGDGPATEQQLRRVLTNISTIALSTVGEEAVTLDILTVHMDYAKPKDLINSDATSADYVEECQCPLGREGQFCDQCSPGYARDPPNGGPFAACVKCYCSNKTESCDPETGVCQNCTDNTAGDHCEHCRDGYYRNLTSGVCLPCHCPATPDQFNHFASSCHVTADHDVLCSCNEGYMGDMCSFCVEGYYGNPLLPTGDCKPCNCDTIGSTVLSCDQLSGRCSCRHGYTDIKCDVCSDDYYHHSNGSCIACECKNEASLGCDRLTGQCMCRRGVTGRSCDVCEEGTNNVWPDCILCDEDCYNIWNDSIAELTEVVNASVTEALASSNISSANVSAEEFDQLWSLVNDLSAVVNSSNFNLTELNRVDQLVVMVTKQVIPQIQAASEINDSIISINNSEVVLLERLELMKSSLTAELTDLDQLQLDLTADNGSNQSSQVQLALNRSSTAYEVISNDVMLIIDMIVNSTRVYNEKLNTFLSIEAQIYNLSSLVNNAMTFAKMTNSFLCGDEMSSNGSDSNCDGIFRISMTTLSQVVISAMQINESLSMVARVESKLKELLDMLELSSQHLNTINDYQLPDEVMMLKDDMLLLNEKLSNKLNSSILLLIESLINQSLELSLKVSPAEVSNVTTMIDRIINEFPSDSYINEVKSRINETLQLAINSQQMSTEVANDSLTAAIALGELQERHDRTVNMKNEMNETLDEFIRIIREATEALEKGMMLLEQLNSRQSILDRHISDVMGHVNNSQFAASSLSNSSIVVYNLTVNCSEEWRKVNNTANELVNNSTAKATKSEMRKIRSEELLTTIKKLLNDTEEQQKELDGLQEQYKNYLLTYQMIEDDVKSVRITLEALIRDISRITTANTNCINPLSDG